MNGLIRTDDGRWFYCGCETGRPVWVKEARAKISTGTKAIQVSRVVARSPNEDSQ
jgi:hypothetical protein